MSKRILILGPSGSGKTYISSALRKKVLTLPMQIFSKGWLIGLIVKARESLVLPMPAKIFWIAMNFSGIENF